MTHGNIPTNLTVSIVTPTGGFRVDGAVNGTPISLLVDTGSAVTLIRKDVWDQMQSSAKTQPLQRWSEYSLVGADGTQLDVCGHTIADISIEGHTYQADVVVVSPLTTEAILGLDFMRKNEVSLDLGKGKLVVGNKPPVPIHPRDSTPPKEVGCVRTSKTVRLPPFSELLVMASVDGDAPEGSCILEKLQGGRTPCVVARALVKPCDGRVPVCFLNPKPEPAVISANTVVATIEEAEPPTSELVANVSAQPLTHDKEELLWNIVESSGTELSQDQREQFYALLSRYADVFASTSADLGRTSELGHQINTGNATPIRQAVRRIPPDRRKEVQRLLDDMLANKVIQPSKSPWASPIVLVRNKDNSLRFCVDYRKLNDVTFKDAYPLPRIDDTLNTLAGSKWFSTLDLLSGYWQVEVAEEDRAKTAFCTTEGLFEFRVMPFGLCNAPATFQRLMDLVLAGLQWSHCLVYLDDVIILGASFDEHLASLQLVFDRLQKAGLRLQPKKCHFLKHRVQYLGHIVSDEGVQVDPAKLDKVAAWPTPTSTKEVQQFLGLAGYYRRFIRDFAKIARPLHKLTEHKATFKWTRECQDSLEALKRKLVTSPVLTYPDYSKPFILDTDASDTGIGAVLSQVDDNGDERVVAYASRLLSKPERRYCVTRRELLAVVAFTRHFRPFLLGRPFVLRTDHGSLTWLKNFKEPEGQMARWLERLQEFDFTIEHRQGKKHTNADSLSRFPCSQCGRETHNQPIVVASTFLSDNVNTLKQLQLDDPTISPVLKSMLKCEKPSNSVIRSMGRDTQRLYQIWDQLVVQDDKLYRQFQPPGNNSATPTLRS